MRTFTTTSGQSLLAVSLAALAALAPAAARAQPVSAYYEDQIALRDGLTIGVGLGVGHLECGGAGCDGVTEAAGADVHLGAMLTPRLAIVAELWAMGHRADRVDITHTLATLGAQVWLLPRLWVRAGAGVAHADFGFGGALADVPDRTETVPGAVAGVGLELVTSRGFALDLQLRGGSGLYDDGDTRVHDVALSLGMSWY
jgi:hypothetical protein